MDTVTLKLKSSTQRHCVNHTSLDENLHTHKLLKSYISTYSGTFARAKHTSEYQISTQTHYFYCKFPSFVNLMQYI